jgi:glycosyltransferase involved in cell wall biosynthesis
MHHRLPVVAYGVTAVPETVLDAGIVLSSKSPSLVACAVRRVVTDSQLRATLVDKGLKRSQEFSLDAARQGLVQAVDRALRAA